MPLNFAQGNANKKKNSTSIRMPKTNQIERNIAKDKPVKK